MLAAYVYPTAVRAWGVAYAAAIGRVGDRSLFGSVLIQAGPIAYRPLPDYSGRATTSRPSSALAARFRHELLQTLIGNLSRDQVAFGVHCQGVYVLELAGVGTFPSD